MFDPIQFLKNMTTLPGVYQMFDVNQTLLYVGKAKNLKKRLASYFNASEKSNKTRAMIEQVVDIKTTITKSESEALLLECNLIKEHHPKYNILMRDDKTYPYILLSKHAYPRLESFRGIRNKNSEFYGPFPNASAVRQTLKLIQKIFKLRNCRDSFFKLRTRPCLQHQIGRCSAPCVKKISELDYQADVNQVRLLLQGKSEEVLHALATKMDMAAQKMEYEQAAFYRDRIANVRHIQSLQSLDLESAYSDVFESIVSAKKKYFIQSESLRDILSLDEIPQRIECFDISHMQGEAIVGSCVVFNHEGALKQDYRRFTINDITPGDDYAAMRQVLQRRYERRIEEESVLPDLIIIDGGWGQVNIAREVLQTLNCHEPVLIGISKGPERRAGHDKILIANSKKELLFEINNPGFLLIQHIRDEAHRFAVAGHQMARKKKRVTSVLENIPGVGAKRRRDLLRHFGGLQGLQQASEKDIAKAMGIGAGLAKIIFDHLH
ncbi:MAG: excinuclease ABC subunit UvrC [Pseudomonadota bacterium]